MAWMGNHPLRTSPPPPLQRALPGATAPHRMDVLNFRVFPFMFWPFLTVQAALRHASVSVFDLSGSRYVVLTQACFGYFALAPADGVNHFWRGVQQLTKDDVLTFPPKAILFCSLDCTKQYPKYNSEPQIQAVSKTRMLRKNVLLVFCQM